MIWIFILAGAFAQSAQAMGAIDATVNPDLTAASGQSAAGGNLFGIVLHFSPSVRRSVPLSHWFRGCRYRSQDGCQRGFHDGGSSGWCLFGDNLSFIFRYDHCGYPYARCVMRDKFRVNSLIALPAALAGIRVLCYIRKPY